MLRLLPLTTFICIYLFSWWRCKKNIIASDKQLKPCIDWAYIKNLPLPPKPSFVEFYIVYVSSFLIPNVTEDFLAVRPSGNPISAKVLVGMFDNKDLVAESSELIKTHKIEIYGDIAYAVFTLNEIFSYKGNQNKDLSTYTCIFKNENGTWKYAWMQRSQGTTDMKTWE